MLDRITGKPVHAYIQFIACLAIAVGMPWSKVPISFATLLLLLNFLLKGSFREYWSNWKNTKGFLLFPVFLSIEFISLIWTSNFQYFLSDFVVKLPFYFIPLSLVAIPIQNKKQIHALILAFLGMLLLTSFINVGSYFHWWGNKTYDDIRSLSLFQSHIRYALLIVIGIVLSLSWIIQIKKLRIIPIVLILWFLYYTNLSQIISGFLSLSAVIFVLFIWTLFQFKHKLTKIILISIFGIFTISGSFWIIQILKPIPHKINEKDFPKFTAENHPYTGILSYIDWENGYPVNRIICEEELEPAWNNRSKIDYETGVDVKGQQIKFTLWRYMTSLGLYKDRAGIAKLNQKDIQLIENGIPSCLQAKNGLKSRLYGLSAQMTHQSNPNGHSLLQRFVSWRAATHIIRNNPLIGVGNGDVDDAFKKYYAENHSDLLPENQIRAHNQYLTIWISSGILGFFVFLALWTTQLYLAVKNRSIEWLCFIAIVAVSFLIEDTIETQLGGVICAFGFGLFTAYYKKEKIHEKG